METTNNNKISYVRKPLARRSFMSVGLAAAGLVLFAAGIWMGVRYFFPWWGSGTDASRFWSRRRITYLPRRASESAD